jgi:hypothetical protein
LAHESYWKTDIEMPNGIKPAMFAEMVTLTPPGEVRVISSENQPGAANSTGETSLRWRQLGFDL